MKCPHEVRLLRCANNVLREVRSRSPEWSSSGSDNGGSPPTVRGAPFLGRMTIVSNHRDPLEDPVFLYEEEECPGDRLSRRGLTPAGNFGPVDGCRKTDGVAVRRSVSAPSERKRVGSCRKFWKGWTTLYPGGRVVKMGLPLLEVSNPLERIPREMIGTRGVTTRRVGGYHQ